ncbi:hypothetical protein RI129_011858 [Pyrocoelia pectoralis]|uniref:Uncharacterized protein n=1 Tax=Pyrocoelia pectoralis TaxID=417401 RepID=A0AAN7ZG84_9COLE
MRWLWLPFVNKLRGTFYSELAELDCPDDCDCHYFRVNWVTDYSNSNLTEIPYNELSLNVYILDVNSNRITNVKPFPFHIKMRRLQLSDNLMTELKRESFSVLNYLIDSDFFPTNWIRIRSFNSNFHPVYIELYPIISRNHLQLRTSLSKELTHLGSLELNNCKLLSSSLLFSNITYTDFTELQFSNLLHIPKLRLLLPKQLSRLLKLDLSNCNLTSLPSEAFFCTRNITHLILTRNKFKAPDFLFLRFLPSPK